MLSRNVLPYQQYSSVYFTALQITAFYITKVKLTSEYMTETQLTTVYIVHTYTYIVDLEFGDTTHNNYIVLYCTYLKCT